jgi:hypothetical protein
MHQRKGKNVVEQGSQGYLSKIYKITDFYEIEPELTIFVSERSYFVESSKILVITEIKIEVVI